MLQSEVTECGQTCLAMLLNYYGHNIDLVSLRQRHPVSQQGTSVQELINMAGKMNLASRSSKVEIEHLPYLTMPCILHWNLDHFVVLKKIKRKYAIIHDPARGEVKISLKELSNSFSGICIELLPSETFQPKKEERKLRLLDLWSTMTGLWSSLLQVFLLSLALQAFILIAPYHMQLVIDKVLPASDYNLLLVLGVAFVGLVVFENIVNGARSWVIVYLGSKLNMAMGSRLFKHLLHLPMRYFKMRHIGDIQSRFGSIQAIQDMLSSGFVTGVLDGLMLVITLIVMFFYSTSLALMALGLTLLYIIIQLLLLKPIKRIAEEEIIKGAKESTFFSRKYKSYTAD